MLWYFGYTATNHSIQSVPFQFSRGYPLPCSGLENFMDRGAWQAAVQGVAESDTTERLSTQASDVKRRLPTPRPVSWCRWCHNDQRGSARETDEPSPRWFCSFPRGFPHSSVGKESACNAGDPGSSPGSGRSPGEGKGYTLQCSGLETV